MSENEVRWDEVDYGKATFHVISYRRPPEPTPQPASEPIAAVEPEPASAGGFAAIFPLFRCWAACR